MPNFTPDDPLHVPLDDEFDATASNNVVSIKLSRFLLHRGVGKSKQTTFLAKLFGVHRSTIHRKFEGEVSTWTEVELAAVAKRFEVRVEQILSGVNEHDVVSVEVRIPKCPSRGQAVLGEMLDEFDVAELVAVQERPRSFNDDGGQGSGDRLVWAIYPRLKAPKDAPKFGVLSLTIESPPYMRVALLEDDVRAGEATVEALHDFGIAVRHFVTVEEFVSALEGSRFEAFIFDWMIGGSTSEDALNHIRQQEARNRAAIVRPAPIIVMTGAMTMGGGDMRGSAETIAAKCRAAGASVHAKPTPPAFLAATLLQMRVMR